MNAQKTILIVDDDPSILEVLDARLSAAGFIVKKASNGHTALSLLKNNSIHLLVTDMKMPEMSGMELLVNTRSIKPTLPIIILTAFGTIPSAVEALKHGAVDYRTKPFDGRELVTKIINNLATPQPDPKKPTNSKNFLWGQSKAMEQLNNLVEKVASSDANILILGESGVGKECIASLLHSMSPRNDHPYIVVDCGSTPPGILESELFGHVKGSFTHAIQDKKGLIEAAHKGSLFLDEVGNISPEMQSRLLRFLEERKIRQVGAIKEKLIDCRVISATNADIKADVDEGKFRHDLYYRLKVVTINIPPLRQRREDIPELARFFVNNYTKKHNLPEVELPQKTIQWLQNMDWPGNVRELKNGLQTGIILCHNNTIYPEDLQLDDKQTNTDSTKGQPSFSIEESEKEAIIRALKQTKGVKKDAAELLGISRRAIQYKSKKYNLDASQFKN